MASTVGRSARAVAQSEMEQMDSYLGAYFDKMTPLYAGIKSKKAIKVSGRDMRIAINPRGGGQIRNFDPDGGALGLGSGDVWTKLVVQTTSFVQAAQWTWLSKWESSGGKVSVVDTTRRLVRSQMKQLSCHLDGQLCGDGTATVATVSKIADSSVTYGVGKRDSVSGDTGTETGGVKMEFKSDGFGSRRLLPGQVVIAYNVNARRGNGSNENFGRIVCVSVSPEDNTAIFKKFKAHNGTDDASLSSVAANDVLLMDGATNSTFISDSKERPAATKTAAGTKALNGVLNINDASSTGSYLGLNRAHWPEIKGNTVDAGGSFNLPAPRKLMRIMGTRLKRTGWKGYKFWMHPFQVEEYEALGQLISVIQKMGSGNQKLDMYFSHNLQICGVPVQPHWGWKDNRIDLLNMKSWARAEKAPVKFYKHAGERLVEMRAADGSVQASNLVYIYTDTQVYCPDPHRLGSITNLRSPT